MKRALGKELSIERDAVFTLLYELASDNADHFRQCPPTTYAKRMVDCCGEIATSMGVVKNLVKHLQEVSRECDYDENTPGNGLRSLVCVSDVVLLRLVSLLHYCAENRTSLMFRLSHYCKEIESYGAVLRFLTLAFNQVILMLNMLQENSLFPPLDTDYEQFHGILKAVESLDASCFYGRPLGFQFPHSVARIFRIIGIVLATYSLSWESRATAFASLINSGKLLLNPEQRAVRIIKITREADISFCRGFWNLSEIPVSKLFCPTMAISESREIPLAGPMSLDSLDNNKVLIREPSAHTGARPVQIKVLSFSHRIGLSPQNAANKLPLSSSLVIHCHGGGFVATSSKSHETYLRGWAKSLNCPVVSIDYSLAPENPFPRAIEEVLYAYAWILNNPDKIGWDGEKVCMVGDSAGGNLIVAVNLRLAELKVKRIPDGIVPIYTPFLFQYLPSPSRVLSFMDPLLHMGVVVRCAAAYTGAYSDEELDKDCAYHDKESGPFKHKSLEEYVDEVKRAQKDNFLDFSQGSQSIVSLINLSQNKGASSPNISKNKKAAQTETIAENLLSLPESKEVSQSVVETDDTDDDVEVNEVTNQTVQVNGHPSVHQTTSSADFIQGKAEVVVATSENKECTDVLDPKRKYMPKSVTADELCSSSFSATEGTATSLDDCSASTIDRGINGNHQTGPVTSFCEKRKLARNKCRSLSQSLADSAVLAAGKIAGHAYDNLSEWLVAPNQQAPIGAADKKKLSRAVTMSAKKAAVIQLEEASKFESHFTELLKVKLPRDHLMSPMYASKELLQRLPPLYFLACHLDPLLDDTVTFAKRVRDAGGRVASIDLIDSLPHGFLNFSPMSVECREGSNLCLKRIKESLNMLN
ncbi:alpha/beta hydrolase fold domain-containing protein [Ditylenchus destructor]|uniref:Alpha/beta hydrolase fold domain-containing protein n=1 Tax=Ditylenchus destructor TaxID=166010 RepID=A0AAD4NGS0_9BILA|nr:alpha/beta hydrolase fold domain-containing protein [Ditylenchus destructor]